MSQEQDLYVKQEGDLYVKQEEKPQKKKKIHWNILDVNLPLHLYTENIPTRYFTATGSHAHIHIYVVRFQDARPLTGTKIDLPLRYYAVFILTQNIIEIYQNKAFICGVVLFFAS